MAKHNPIGGNDPLSAMIPDRKAKPGGKPSTAKAPKAAAPKRTQAAQKTPARPAKPAMHAKAPPETKAPLSARLDPSLIERVRDAAWSERLTIDDVLGAAVSEWVDRMERKRGKPYPPRGGELKKGRPIR